MENFRHLHNWEEECNEPQVPAIHSLDALASLISSQPLSWRVLEQIPALTSGHGDALPCRMLLANVAFLFTNRFLGVKRFWLSVS